MAERLQCPPKVTGFKSQHRARELLPDPLVYNDIKSFLAKASNYGQ